ncbi:protocatechuate 3,4-dioxygenase subunit alpha [Leifsonia bigeumensis]|uniref:Protocatechuate 3,4-dioxygenase subunit alpha n=1 Tax=Leifsonella bigeumensis TaxID=433643 RepID=A0ABP7FW81_9MICO
MNRKPPPTPGQTVGPFFGYALPYEGGGELVPAHHPGAVRLSGTVFDGAGTPIPDALVELWQPDERGEIPRTRGSLTRDGHTFTGFGRSATTRDGRYSFTTVEPGVLAGSASAPFFACLVFARGLTDKLHSRIYLPGFDELAAKDPLLSSLLTEQRATLMATRQPDGSLHHDFHLQGDEETVFLDFG